MKAVWDKAIILVLCLMAMPRANLMGPRSEMSHFDLSSSQNLVFSSGGFAIENMLSMWTVKIMVPEAV